MTRYVARYAILALLLIFGVIVGVSTTATADDGVDIREAGAEDKFRVVDRFPDRQQESTDIETVSDDSPFYPVVEHVRHEEWSDAQSTLNNETLRAAVTADPGRQFLAGYVALQANRPKQATEYFDQIDDQQFQVLSDYRSFFAAKAAYENDDFHRATVKASAVSDDSRLHERATYLLARSLVEAGEEADLERAAQIMELYLSSWGDGNDGPRVSLLLGEVLEELERPEQAARVYYELYDGRPLRSEAREAKDRLGDRSHHLSDTRQAALEEETDDRKMRRYRGLYDLHRSQRVVDELSDKVDDFPARSDERCQGLFKIAHSYTKLRQHGNSTTWYERILDECSHTDYERRALYHGARGMWNAGNRDGAIEWFEQLWRNYPDDSIADDAMYLQARVLRSADRNDEARQMFERQVQTYPDGDKLKDAHWFLVRDLFERDDPQGVIDYVDGLERTGEDDLYTRGRLHYFRGRALEMLEDDEGAKAAFADVAEQHPKSYYALLAINRLARVTDEDTDDVCAAAAEVCDEVLSGDIAADDIAIPDELRDDSAFERGTELLALGLDGHARAEFSDLRRRHSNDPEILWALANLLDRAGAYPLSHNIARRHINGWMNEYPTNETRQQWKVAYPTPFDEEVNRYAERRQIPAAKIYAIMREESGFNPRIESWANARGLLQLLDNTAERMASRVGMNPYSFDRLDDPDVNIRLGTAYMEQLGESFDDHPVLVSAGYNGGSGNVQNWLDDFGDLPLDLFVEDIPFQQTRNYAKRVTMSYWIYTYLYSEQRVPKLAFGLPH